MTEDPHGSSNDNAIVVPTPFGTNIKITGVAVIFFVFNLGAAWFFYDFLSDQNLDRSHEHDEIACKLDLDIYLHTVGIDLAKAPRSIYRCLPEYLWQHLPEKK